MNKKNHKPVFIDHQIQEQHFKIFGVKNYDELVMYLKDKNIYDEIDYNKLVEMVKIMIVPQISSTLEGYHPDIERNFFQKPQNHIIGQIYSQKLYENDDYLDKISNVDYKKIDELVIDHINFLLLEDWNDKYDKIEDIIAKISDQLILLQEYFVDPAVKEKMSLNYIFHVTRLIIKSLSLLLKKKLISIQNKNI